MESNKNYDVYNLINTFKNILNYKKNIFLKIYIEGEIMLLITNIIN